MNRRAFLRYLGFGSCCVVLPQWGCSDDAVESVPETAVDRLAALQRQIYTLLSDHKFDDAESAFDELAGEATAIGTYHSHNIATFAATSTSELLALYGFEDRATSMLEFASDHAYATPANTMGGELVHFKAKVSHLGHVARRFGILGHQTQTLELADSIAEILNEGDLGTATSDIVEVAYPDLALGLYAAGSTDEALATLGRLDFHSTHHRLALVDIAAFVTGRDGREAALQFASTHSSDSQEQFYVLTDHIVQRPGVGGGLIRMGRLQEAATVLSEAAQLLDDFDDDSDETRCEKSWAYGKLARLFGAVGDTQNQEDAQSEATALDATCSG